MVPEHPGAPHSIFGFGADVHPDELPAQLGILMGYESGRVDLNHRPPGPEPGALTGLRYAPQC
jgi:hypothetical protein